VHRRSNQRGMALIAVVAVLIALVLIATPFALQMRNAKKRSEALLYTEQADQESRNVMAMVKLFLLNTTEDMERRNAQARSEGVHNTPDYDTPEEFQPPLSLLRDFNENSSKGIIWDVRVEDESAKVNVNSAPYTLLANLFGSTTLTRDLQDGDTRVRVSDPSLFSPEGGLVRVGNEMIRYQTIVGDTLEGVERGVDGDRPWNSAPGTWKQGTLVMDAVAFEIATYPIRAVEGGFTVFRNPYHVKRVSDLGTVGVDPDEFDRVIDKITCHSGRVVAGGWSNSQKLRSDLPSSEAEDDGEYMIVDNPWYYGLGTLVRITDGENVDYGIVIGNNGFKIQLGAKLRHEYDADEAWVESLARHPVNVNTASREVLVACLQNVAHRLRGNSETVSLDEARALADRIREKPVKSLYQFKELLRAAEAEGVISIHDVRALYWNALNPQDYRLKFSTVPFAFRSFDVYTVKATAVVNSKVGEEIARKTVRSVVSVAPRRSAMYHVESQADFEEHLIASRDAKYMMTFPYNTGGHYQGRNIPPSRFVPHWQRDIWPSSSREPMPCWPTPPGRCGHTIPTSPRSCSRPGPKPIGR